MEIKLINVEEDEKEILKNLLEKYNYEFSKYDDKDVNELGLYGYKYLDHYWGEENRWAFFIYVEDKLAGFVMVNNHQETDKKTDFSMAEFFVMNKYRRNGVGRYVIEKIFNKFKGSWQLRRHPKNLEAAKFWDKVIGDYTNGNYKIIYSYPNTEFSDGTLADIMFFET